MNENFKIDFVVTWVDGSDEEWLRKKRIYLPEDKRLNGSNRFRKMSVFEYWFKNVYEYASWVNNIYLVTDNQKPDFINKYPKVKIIDHSQIIEKKYLPTFNSNSIELNVWKIPKLAEHFVLFNDDMFISQPVQTTDFFDINGNPRLSAVLNVIQPSDEFSYIPFNNMELLNKKFSKANFIKKNWSKVFNFSYGKRNFQSLLALPYPSITGFHEDHQPVPHLKSSFKKLATSDFKKDFKQQTMRRFRTHEDISHWLVKEYNILNGRFSVKPIKEGKLFRLRNLMDLNEISENIKKYKLICINDNVKENDDWQILNSKLYEVFRDKFGEL